MPAAVVPAPFALGGPRLRVLMREFQSMDAQVRRQIATRAQDGFALAQDGWSLISRRNCAAMGGQLSDTSAANASATPGTNLLATFRITWQNDDYRKQFWGRMGAQCAQGIYYGTSILLLNMYGGALRGSGSQLADAGIRGAEMLCYQLGSFKRAQVETTTRTRNTSENVAKASRSTHIAALLYSWVGEVALAACFLGVMYCRCAAWLTTRRMVLLLGTARVVRVFFVQNQYATLDKIKGLVEPAADAKKINSELWPMTRWMEQSAGMLANIGTGIAMQYMPALVPQPAMLGLLVGLTTASILISLATKLPMLPYLDEGIADHPDTTALSPIQ